MNVLTRSHRATSFFKRRTSEYRLFLKRRQRVADLFPSPVIVIYSLSEAMMRVRMFYYGTRYLYKYQQRMLSSFINSWLVTNDNQKAGLISHRNLYHFSNRAQFNDRRGLSFTSCRFTCFSITLLHSFA